MNGTAADFLGYNEVWKSPVCKDLLYRFLDAVCQHSGYNKCRLTQ